MDEKKFGGSVFDLIPEKDDSVSESDFFNDLDYDKDEVDKMRKDLIDNCDNKVKTLVTKDSMSGMRAETMEEDAMKQFDEIDSELKKKDIQGKTITAYGKSLLRSVMNRDATDDECLYIASKIEDHKDIIDSAMKISSTNTITNDSVSLDIVEDIFPEEIRIQIREIVTDKYEEVLRRFLYQIAFSYINTLETRDDISELNKLSRMVKKAEIMSQDETMDDDKRYDSLMDISDSLTKFMELKKSLDDRNKRMKQDYTIDDIEAYNIKEIHNCLEDAINFIPIKNKVDTSAKKVAKDLKHMNDVNNSIDNWINDIKNDPKVIYTFPCNDFLSASESREAICNFFYNSYLAYITKENGIEIPIEKDLEEYLFENNIITTKDKEELEYKAKAMLYIISRTFKYKKVENNSLNIRKLSYTLDIISKLGMDDHLKSFIEASDYMYDKIRG